MENVEINVALAAVDDRHFAIVEKDQAMVYDNSKFYPTPIPVHHEKGAFKPDRSCKNCSHAHKLAPHEYACDAGEYDIDTLSCFQPRNNS